MKIAIVHDWLNHKLGGAEIVLFDILNQYPEADIFTLVYNPKKFDKYLANRKVTTSRLQKFPRFIRNKPKLLLPFIKKSIDKLNFEGYDLIITSSTAWVKNINVPSGTRHVCYCCSPARMLWDSWPKYVDDMELNPIAKFYLTRLASKLRLWDYYSSQRDTEFVAISKHVQDRIKKFYGRGSVVIFPPVNLTAYKSLEADKEDYYLILSVMAKYKNVELAIRAFMISGKKLVVAGDGPDLERLKQIAAGANNIKFLGRISDDHKIELMSKAKGFIFCNIEDFGITMVESIAAGTGVIALKGGGASEIIKQSKTGVFYDNPNEEELNRAIIKYEKSVARHKIGNKYVFDKFSKERFLSDFTRLVNEK